MAISKIIGSGLGTIVSDTVTFTSANSTDPRVIIKNTTNDANAAVLNFIKDKGANGADDDSIGSIFFTGDNDAQQQTLFGRINGLVETAADGAEGGKIQLQVATHDGEMKTGFEIFDGSAEDEIDVNIGQGTASLTTITGAAHFGADVDLVQAKHIRFKHQAGGTIRASISAESNDKLQFNTGSSETARMTIDTSGNVGIGLTAPTAPLHIQAADNADLLRFTVSGQEVWAFKGASVSKPTSGNDTISFGIAGGAQAMTWDELGTCSKPLQPAFQGAAGTLDNITENGQVQFLLFSETFDQGGNFRASTGDGQNGNGSNLGAQFTAPVTGKYQLNVHVLLTNVDSAASHYQLQLVTSNRLYYETVDPDYGQDSSFVALQIAVLADMDADDTAVVKILQSGGSQQTDINTTTTKFSGFLAC